MLPTETFPRDGSSAAVSPLSGNYASTVGKLEPQAWHSIAAEFADANLYQMTEYGLATRGDRGISHFVLRRDGIIVAAALARVAKLPMLPCGVAYIRWGPMWRKRGLPEDPEVFREALRGLREEYTVKRGLTVRLLPLSFLEQQEPAATALNREGFLQHPKTTHPRTIVMDLEASMDQIKEAMKPHWRRELKVAEKRPLEVVEGTSDELFQEFIWIYKEMVARKKFIEPNDVHKFRIMQNALPESLKMTVMLCRRNQIPYAGLVCSAMGDSAVYLFGATSNEGRKSNGSYLLQWRYISYLKERGIRYYNLNGVNPVANPGTYKFKSDLAGTRGRDVHYLGQFDCNPAGPCAALLTCATEIRSAVRSGVNAAKGMRRRVGESLRELASIGKRETDATRDELNR